MLVPSIRREVSTTLFICLLRTTSAVVAPPERPAWARGFAGVAFSKDRTHDMKSDVMAGAAAVAAASGTAAAHHGTASRADPGNLLVRPFGRASTAQAAGGAATQTKSSGIGTLMAPKPQVCIRTARREDIPQIEACNLKTLPENYPNAFYHNHLLQWPYLALVAERRPASSEGNNEKEPAAGNGQGDKRIVGYVLGRVAGPGGGYGMEAVVEGEQDRLPGFEAEQPPPPPGPKTGHVSSLAVLDDYRRQGIARELMDILHVQMQFRYGVDCSTLHVRCSNRGAQKLYVDTLGYEIVETVPRYYQDGADAYYMRLDFTRPSQSLDGVAGRIPVGGIRLQEKTSALLTQDSQGYFQLYPQGGAGGGAASASAGTAAAASAGAAAASSRPTA